MKKYFISLILFLLAGMISYAQVGVNTDNTSPNSSAMLDVKSTTKGFLAPRMTFTERNTIATPAEGLVVFCTNCKDNGAGCISLFMGGQWLNLAGTCDLPVSPAEGSHVQSNTQIIWNWNSVPIATGYKWSTSTNYSTAIDLGTGTTKTETGLVTGNSYKRYVWAYNACGHSDSTILAGQALICGSSFTKIHTAGVVAPVDKTITYGTVTNIPGETSKCWITRNLGATQQANSVSDNTEPSAGWYWQFNLKQGYKYASTRIPNTTWITLFTENSDWTSENDPCSLLLGSAWRIPTSTEWTNVDAAGNWTNWNGPFSSGLQLHAAGFLAYTDGVLGQRGSNGTYWGSTQVGAPYGEFLFFTSVSSVVSAEGKGYGFPVRCIRD
ncbi:MAG: hypothetical protein ACOYNC_09530 [Bacteroidales bacterium]